MKSVGSNTTVFSIATKKMKVLFSHGLRFGYNLESSNN